MQKKAKYKAILFDLDGTLIDTAPDFIIAANLLRNELNLAPLEKKIIQQQVSNGAAAITHVITDLPLNHPLFEEHRQRLLTLYAQCLPNTASALFPGMAALLHEIRQQTLFWGIVTNKPVFFSNLLLAALNLKPDCLICPDHVQHKKPHAEPLLKACEVLGILPCDALYIGDHTRDIESGINAKMDTVGVTYGYLEAGDHPTRWGAKFVVEQAQELISLIF